MVAYSLGAGDFRAFPRSCLAALQAGGVAAVTAVAVSRQIWGNTSKIWLYKLIVFLPRILSCKRRNHNRSLKVLNYVNKLLLVLCVPLPCLVSFWHVQEVPSFMTVLSLHPASSSSSSWPPQTLQESTDSIEPCSTQNGQGETSR